jgi:hypothetical protein
MAYFTPLREETLADQRRYLEDRLVEVACLDCLARVRVKKNSEYHTSIQWTVESAGQCAEFARSSSEGRRIVHESCPRLAVSIATAVRDGRLSWEAGDG